MLKFPVDGGIVTIRSTILILVECATVITSSAVPKEPSDMTGVPRSVTEHRLNIREGYSPVRQKKRGQDLERAKAIQAEVQKLVEARIMREVYYHDWLSNPVMIQLAESDEEKTAFHTGQGVYYYTKMPFGLKKAGATYQRLVDEAFDSQIVEGMFLGYMVTPEKIKPCPKKTKYVLQLPSLRTIKEAQSLNRKLASLNRFLSKSAEKSLLLFKTLKKCIKKSDFHWTSEAEQDFKQLKQHLSELPLLVAPKPKEELIVYLSASYDAISAVLITERGTVQTPVYFVSRVIQGLKLNYTPMEKLVLSLVFAAKRLRRYFQAHPIAVITDQPIKQTMSRPDVSCMDGSGARLILTNSEGTEFTYALRFQFAASNNEAVYEALIAGLRIVAQMGVQNVHVSVDSKLVANQVLGTYVAKEENMIKYLEKVKSLEGGNKASHQGPTVRIIGGGSLQAIIPYAVVREIHEGSCSMHAGPRSVVAEAIRLGYYWTTMHQDARDMIRTCNDCQIHHPITRNPQQPLTPITAPWLFYKWGIDIAGPFPEGPGKVKILIVSMDYFMKRIEAKAVETITGSRVCGVAFKPCDFVYRSNDVSHAVDGGKLGPKWEGPYKVTKALEDRAYKLRSMDGTVLSRTWNIANLKKCYL
nr:hypothetical protein [Tanacetum cinerariifolium]